MKSNYISSFLSGTDLTTVFLTGTIPALAEKQSSEVKDFKNQMCFL